MTAEVPAPALAEGRELALPSYKRPPGLHPPLDFEWYRSTALRHPKQAPLCVKGWLVPPQVVRAAPTRRQAPTA